MRVTSKSSGDSPGPTVPGQPDDRLATGPEQVPAHVLVVSPVIPMSIYRGSETRVAAMVRALIAEGYRVSLAVLNMSLHDAESETIARDLEEEFSSLAGAYVFNHAKVSSSIRGRLRYAYLTVVDGVTGDWSRVHGYRECPPEFRSFVGELCDRLAPDFLFVNYAKLAPAVPDGFEGVRVLDSHDYQTRFLIQDQRLHRKRRWVDRKRFEESELAAMQRFDRVIAINPDEKEAFESIDRSLEIGFVPAFCEPSVATDASGVEATYDALFVGSQLSFNVSGLAWFIEEVLPSIREREPGFRLGVVGNIDLAIPDMLRGAAGVDYRGVVDDLRPIYDASRCVIAPVLGGAGMKIKVVEALAHGKAVVATPTALEGIRFEHGRDVLVAQDATAFADAISSVLHDPALRHRLEQGARSLHARDHSPDAVRGAIRSLFRPRDA